jgi:hypothetical protein
MAAGVGDVGVSGAAERTGDEVADASHRVGLVPGAHLLLVFAECDVADIIDRASHCSFPCEPELAHLRETTRRLRGCQLTPNRQASG